MKSSTFLSTQNINGIPRTEKAYHLCDSNEIRIPNGTHHGIASVVSKDRQISVRNRIGQGQTSETLVENKVLTMPSVHTLNRLLTLGTLTVPVVIAMPIPKIQSDMLMIRDP